MEIVIRSRKKYWKERKVWVSDDYTRGKIKKGYFPFEGKYMYYVGDVSGGGGSRKKGLQSSLSVINFKESKRKDLISVIKKFCEKNELFFEKANKNN